MYTKLHFALGLSMLVLVSQAAFGQRYVKSQISNSAVRRAGLEMAWQTHVAIDPARGRIEHVMVYVSGVDRIIVFEVTHDGGKRVFHEQQIDFSGQPLGEEGARRAADIERRVLEQQGIEAEVVEHVVPKVTLLAQTNRGMLEAIDGETGRTLWRLSPGRADYPSLEPAVNDRYAAIVNGSTLYLYDMLEEKLKWHRRLGTAPGAGAIVGDEFVFVPLMSGVVEGFSLEDDKRPKLRIASSGRAMVQPTLSPHSLSWPTDRGHLYVADPVDGTQRYRLEAGSPLVASSAFLPPNKLFVASVDGFVYATNELTGELIWRFSSGEPIVRAPLALEERVYVATDYGNMHALSADVGRQIWQTGGIRSVLSASKDRVYCQDTARDLAVLDAQSGSRLARVPMANVDFAIGNSLTDRIYLGTRSGRLVCLREQGKPWPMLHGVAKSQVEKILMAREKAAADAEEATTEKPSAAAADEPTDAEPVEGDVLFGDPLDGGEEITPNAGDEEAAAGDEEGNPFEIDF